MAKTIVLNKHQFAKDIKDALHDVVYDAVCKNQSEVLYEYEFEDCSCIGIEYKNWGYVEINAYDTDGSNKGSIGIALGKAVFDAIPEWSDIEKEVSDNNNEDEWDAHGFRDEADYLRWRYC